MLGGTGNDTYVFSRGHGDDIIWESDATVGNVDVLNVDSSVAYDQFWFSKFGSRNLMSTKSRDTRTSARLLIDAYIEALVGLFALRLEPVKAAVRSHAPDMSVLSSFEGEHVNLHAAHVVDTLTTSSAELKTAAEILTAAFVARMWDLLRSHARYDTISTEPRHSVLSASS